MKKILIFLAFILCNIVAFSQADTSGLKPFNGKGERVSTLVVPKLFLAPSDTTAQKYGLAQIGGQLYVGNGIFWREVANGNELDSLDLSIYALQQALIDTAAQIRADLPEQANQILFGGEVTQINDSLFFITGTQSRIGGVVYTANDTTLEIDPKDSESRIDLFYTDITSRIRSRKGTPSANPAPPSITPGSELVVGFVTVDTATVTINVIPPNYWAAAGSDIQNLNTGSVLTSQQMKAGQGFNLSLTTGVFNGIRTPGGNNLDFILGNNQVGRASLIGSAVGSYWDYSGTVNPASGTGISNGLSLRYNFTPLGVTSRHLNQLSITPTYSQVTGGSGAMVGIYYSPTIVTLGSSPHYAAWFKSGGIRAEGLSYSADTTYLGLCVDANGNFYRCPRSTGSGGGSGITRQELIDTATAIRSSLATFQQRMYDSLAAIRAAIPAAGITQQALDDSIAAARNYTTENIRFVAAGDGVVMTVTGDTARFSVDTTYIQNIAHPYKSYIALVNQTGTDAPTATVLYNNLGVSLTFSYINTGLYEIINPNGWDNSKTYSISNSVGNTGNSCCGQGRVSISLEGTSLLIFTMDNSNATSNNVMSDAPIEIRVYN